MFRAFGVLRMIESQPTSPLGGRPFSSARLSVPTPRPLFTRPSRLSRIIEILCIAIPAAAVLVGVLAR
jgi:hypothetical protein